MTVWLVERQGVEESYVVEIFESEELAEDWVRQQCDCRMYQISDWEVRGQQ